MDAKHLKQSLTRILETEIPDTMNLLPNIQKQAENAAAPRPRAVLRPRHVLVVAAMIVLATGAYALYQLIAPPDPGMAAVNNAVTQINQVQTIASQSDDLQNIEVTLATAYADANRINLTYSVTADAQSDGTTLFINPTLTDAAGTVYPFLSAGRGETEEQNGSSFTKNGSLSFDSTGLNGSPSSLDLTVRFDVAFSNDDVRAADPMGMMMAGGTEFPITVPFYAGEIVAVGQTVESDGVAVTLDRAVITPSLTRLEICAAPETFGAADWWAWSAVGGVGVGGQAVTSGETFTFAGVGGQLLDNNSLCRSVIVPYALTERNGSWSVTLDAFTAETGAQIAGPWVFTFDVP
jgi:hypothetical protein